MKSYKLTIITILTILISMPSFAEGDTKLFGVRAGWQMSDIQLDGNYAGANNSFYIGAFKNNKIIPMLHWTAGLEYFQNGWYVDDNNKQILSTLSVPINIKAKLGPFFALAGIAANFKLSENKAGLLIEDAATFDLPLVAGLGFRILIVNIEARYHWGTQKINDSGAKHQYLQVGAGVSF